MIHNHLQLKVKFKSNFVETKKDFAAKGEVFFAKNIFIYLLPYPYSAQRQIRPQNKSSK